MRYKILSGAKGHACVWSSDEFPAMKLEGLWVESVGEKRKVGDGRITEG
jgi:hypothetical protein